MFDDDNDFDDSSFEVFLGKLFDPERVTAHPGDRSLVRFEVDLFWSAPPLEITAFTEAAMCIDATRAETVTLPTGSAVKGCDDTGPLLRFIALTTSPTWTTPIGVRGMRRHLVRGSGKLVMCDRRRRKSTAGGKG